MSHVLLLQEGEPLVKAPVVLSGKVRSTKWVQGPTWPTHFTIVTDDGETTKELKAGIGKKRKTKKLSGVISRNGLQVLVVVMEGTDPSRPSWNYTIEAKMRGDMAGCSKCGTIFNSTFDPERDVPLCPKCRKESAGVA